MTLRTVLPFGFAALLGASAAVLPALAAPSEAKLEVNYNCDGYKAWPCWTPPGATPEYVRATTIAAGGEVTFVDDSSVAANIAWTGTAPTCSSAVPVSPTPAASGWEGKCKFEAPGDYEFESSAMYSTYRQYEIVVSEPTTTGTTPTGTGTGTGAKTVGGSSNPSGSGGSSTGSGSPGQGGGDAPVGSPFVGSASSACKLPASQHGHAVHGSVDVSSAGAGGRLEVQLLAASASLASDAHSSRMRVGRLVRPSLPAGADKFTVSLDAAARRALRTRGHLALTVKILLTSAGGSVATVIRGVILRG